MLVFVNVFVAMLGVAVVGFVGLAVAKVGSDGRGRDASSGSTPPAVFTAAAQGKAAWR